MGFTALSAVFCALPVLVSLLAVRVAYVLCRRGSPPLRPSAAVGVRCLVVLGSGGHTAETMNIITALQKDRFTPRYYVAALTYSMSLQKAQVYEQSLVQLQSDKEKILKNAQFMQIYSSREVGQSYITSVATTLLGACYVACYVANNKNQTKNQTVQVAHAFLCASALLLKVVSHPTFYAGAWFAMVLDFLH